MKKVIRVISLTITIIILLSGCTTKSFSPGNSVEKAMLNAKISCRKIVYIEEGINSGDLVYYEDDFHPEELAIGYLRKTNNGSWNWVDGGGSALINSPKGLSWVVHNNEKEKIYIVYGTITDSNLDQVALQYGNSSMKAKIVEENGMRIWIVHSEIPIVPPLKIIGITSGGREIEF